MDPETNATRDDGDALYDELYKSYWAYYERPTPDAVPVDLTEYEKKADELIEWVVRCVKKGAALRESDVICQWNVWDRQFTCIGMEPFPLDVFIKDIVTPKFMARFKHRDMCPKGTSSGNGDVCTLATLRVTSKFP